MKRVLAGSFDSRQRAQREEILDALRQRLTNSDAEETAVALEQLREITLLRLAGAIGE
jgi:2-oxo-4-hydroxy-4-carboxy-5-ureidoimidazoline decarboxylase